MFQDDEPKDWETEEEEVPPVLREKWAKDEILGPESVICPSCKNCVPSGSMNCLYCGERVLRSAGFLSGLLARVKKLFFK
ncbi:MAG: hypothetical protein BWY42_00752 [Candidatus Omnitrophica bacterium ADurb.Bin277]|nr:MAG: hypothetical protein BWY42_00752 [Candidatus Omnitrophica bacterium ADurb.Bin277]